MQRHDEAKEVRTRRYSYHASLLHQEQIALAHWRALSQKRKKRLSHYVSR